MHNNPKVFISYSHENLQFEQTVLTFTNKLRAEGIDANIDLYEEAPAEGWPRWMDNQIRTADFVLVICTKSYFDKTIPENNQGKGVSWEVNIVYQYIYDNYSENTKFIPVVFNDSDIDNIMVPLKSFTYYNVNSSDGYDRLYWRLRGVSKIQKPELGKLRALPQKEQKTMFFSTPINLDLWNTARWKGMLYLMYPDRPPILGVLYTNFEAGKKIFLEWKRNYPHKSINDNIEITYIEPPFPSTNPIYKDSERSYGKGYWVHIGPNINKSITRMENSGLMLSESFLATLSRYTWVDEIGNPKNRELFKNLYSHFKTFSLIPAALRDNTKPFSEENLMLGFEHEIHMSNIKFVKGTGISENEIYKTVLKYKEASPI